MTQLVREIRRSTFLRHNAILFAGSLAVGAFNYLYYPILGRLLEPAAFGEVQALVSLFLQLLIFLTVLGLVTVNVVANYESEQRRNEVVFEFEKLALLISFMALLLMILFSQQLKNFLNFEDTWPFIILMIGVIATVPLTFRSSFLRGKKAFGLASISQLIGAVGKLIFSALLVVAGFGAGGAIAGLAVAQILASLYAVVYARKLGLRPTGESPKFSLPRMTILLPELKYGLLVLVGSLVVTLQYSIDIILVKHYFDAHTAGLYAGISSVARIIFFLTASISLVLLPSVKLRHTAAQNRVLLLKSLVLLFGVGMPAVIVFALFPAQIVTTLMGGAYHEYTALLPILSLTIFIISVINLFVSYFIALRRYSIAFIVIIGAVVTYGLMLMHHTTLRAVIDSLLLGSLVMICLLGLWAGSFKLLATRGGEKRWPRGNSSQ